jgi:hypothetical protein
MNKYPTNLENITKLSENTFSMIYNGRSLYLTINKQGDTLYPKLYEELKVRSLKFSDAKRHKVFETCNSIDEIFKQYLAQGKVEIVEDQNKYHLVLFDDITDISKAIISREISINTDLTLVRNIQTCHNNLENNCKHLDNQFNTINQYNKFINKFQKDIEQTKANVVQNLLIEETIIKNSCNEIKVLTSKISKIKGINNVNDYSWDILKEKLINLEKDEYIEAESKINTIVLLPNNQIALGCEEGIHIWDLKNKDFKI